MCHGHFDKPVFGDPKGLQKAREKSRSNGISRRGYAPPRNDKYLVLFFFTLLIFPSGLSALEIPQKPEGYVSDYAGMLPVSARQGLEEKLGRFERETSNQLIVATFPGLEGEALEDYSIRLAEAWKPGQKDRDNGVMLLIFKKDREVRIEVGYGLEGALPDAVAKQIIENEIVPEFRVGNFGAGIEKAVDAVIAVTRGEYRPEIKAEGPDSGLFQAALLLGFFSMINGRFVFLVFQILFLLLAFFLPSLFFGVLSLVLGVLAFMTAAGRRGYYFGGSGRGGSWSSGGSFGGGFRGGGGGFGGGGASGRW